jgi:branched-chain amino acid transport system ATP-binding protein
MATPATSSGSEHILDVRGVTKRFHGLVAVNDVTFHLRRGEILGLIGPNGAGKTTLVSMVNGTMQPSAGDILFEGRSVRALPAFRRAHLGIGRTFQVMKPFPGMSVLENLVVAQHNALMVASGFTFAGLIGLKSYRTAENAAVDKARYWLDRTGLLPRADDSAGALAYGEQRRLEIARAMCTDPVLLCLDEPAAGLNARESAELNAILRFIRKEHAISILLIEHDMSVVMQISDHIVVLDYGIKIADGAPDAIRNDPKVVAAYLGVADDEVEKVEAEVGL